MTKTGILTTILMFSASLAWAQTVTVPHTFSSGTVAEAAQLNANFTAVADGIVLKGGSVSLPHSFSSGTIAEADQVNQNFAASAAAIVSLGGSVVLPHTFVNGTIAEADQVNQNFAALLTGLNAVAVSLTVTIDQAATQPDPATSKPINFTVVFSAPVTGFDASDIVLTRGSVQAVTDLGSGDTYNVAVGGTWIAGWVFTATVNAGAAQDAQGTLSDASTSTDNTVTYTGATSCPFLYVWDGTSFEYESDVFGTGRLGTVTPFGYKRPSPPDYYVLETTPALVEGGYDMRLVNELEEVDFVDRLILYAIQFPENRQVFSEKPVLGVPFTKGLGALHTVANPLRAPVSVTHVNTGEDVTELVASMDRDYAVLSNDANLDYEYHTLEIDFGDQSSAPQVKLILDGRSVFPTTPQGIARKSLFGAPTKMEVPDGAGGWVEVPRTVMAMEPPNGFRRPILLDVTDILVAEDHRLRLTWLFKTYVDAVLMDTTADEPIDAVALTLESADLHYYGLSGRTEGEIYDFIYGAVPAVQPTHFSGSYTKYGDVLELLGAIDDRFMITFGGDEVSLHFSAAAPPEAGKKLGFVFHSYGYYKDTATDLPQTVGPLPFDAMSEYPYDPTVENYPDDAFHNNYLQEWNTRVHP